MRAMLLIFTLTVVHFFSSAQQQQRYIYIQSEPQQAFYVKIDAEVHSSNTNGFLIIPKLKDSVYTIVAGFPQNVFPEYRFQLKRITQDKGFTLKNFEEKGWGLIDNASGEILMGEKTGNDNLQKEIIPPPRTNDAFTVILAAVINDPGLPGTELIGQNASYALTLPPADNRKGAKTGPGTVKTETSKIENDEQVVQQEAVAKTTAPPNETRPEESNTPAQSKETKPGDSKTSVPPTKLKPEESKTTAPPKEKKTDETNNNIAATSSQAKKNTATQPPANKPKKGNTDLVTGPVNMSAKNEASNTSAEPGSANQPEVKSDAKNVAKTEQKKILRPTTIKKFFDNRGAEKHILIYADVYGTTSDTVRVEIPVEELKPVTTQQQSISEKKPDEKNTAAVVEENKKNADVDPVVPPPAKNTDPVAEESKKNSTVETVVPPAATNETTDTATTATTGKSNNRADCKRMAAEKDVQAVRRKIIAIREVDDMVSAALRDFKSRCFTSDQIKSISIVFISEEGKYKLMDAAYPYVYDPSNYQSLESMLHDPYYINRFRSLLK